ncbi:MAG: polyhydroxyalkanoate synthesis regulator DNA-binding domain-containing protein [Myxococcota bacterium]
MVVLIKRYANRKLYNTEASRYITLKGISELLQEGRDIKVVDNESGQDITSIVLSQILVDDQKQGHQSSSKVPGRVLSELISRGGDAIYGVLRRSMDDVSDVRANVRRWIQAPRELDASDIARTVHHAVERVLRVVDLPTRADIEALNKNLERLSSALETIESRLAEPPRATE